MVLTQMGLYEEALSYYEQALAIREKMVGCTNPRVGRRLRNLGHLHLRAGNYEAALQIQQAAQPNHAQTADTLDHLGNLQLQRGYMVEARSYSGASAGDTGTDARRKPY